MSVSKAILSGNFKDLESTIEGETNEVYSTLLFDSYDNKRIEEVLFLEALRILHRHKIESDDEIKAALFLWSSDLYKKSLKCEEEPYYNSGSWESNNSTTYRYYNDDQLVITHYSRNNDRRNPSTEEYITVYDFYLKHINTNRSCRKNIKFDYRTIN